MSKDKIKIFFKTSISSIISAGVDLSVFYFLSTSRISIIYDIIYYKNDS